MNPRYPVYVISKGRWESNITVRHLRDMKVPHYLVVEPQEVDNYGRALGTDTNFLILPFSNLGQGSIPARNFVWDHAQDAYFRRHWILDDNIYGFRRLNRNKKIPCRSGSMFAAAEDFVDRYSNVALAGFQYHHFADQRAQLAPFLLNTRIYSCILVKNHIPYRWRGRYNEDTDLSLRVLKDGWCTVLFYAFLAKKAETMTVSGGNTEELYADDGRLKMAQSLCEQHPDVARVSWKWGRWQHHVDYSPFAGNKLRPVDESATYQGINNYGMVLQEDQE